jgi:MerR family transcriptional regulator, copper efflux regulator
MEDEEERIQVLKKFKVYRKSLKYSEAELLEKLHNFQKDINSGEKSFNEFEEDKNHLKSLSPDDAGELYIISRIKIAKAIPQVLDRHIIMLEEDEDLDRIMVSFEYQIYRVKKDIYGNMDDWEALLNFIPEDKRFQIQKDPKGPVDFILKDLIWLMEYERVLEGIGFSGIHQ